MRRTDIPTGTPMPANPLDRSRQTLRLLVTASCALFTTMLPGCATDRLVASAPQGVDLTGEWRLNENLSDDPQRLEEPKELPPKLRAPEHNPGGFGKPGTTVPGMPGGPGALDPGGDNLTRTAGPDSGLVPVLYAESTDLPGSANDSGPSGPLGKAQGHQGTVSHMLDAPALLIIAQSGSKLIIKSVSEGTSNEYTAGEQRTVPFGQSEADRSSGWRDAAFVVITKAKKGPSKEDDFALDSEGHLIFATLITHVKKGPIDFKRVYDRVRTP